MKKKTRLISLLLAFVLLVSTASALAEKDEKGWEIITVPAYQHPVTEDGSYTSAEDVAVYYAKYKKLPPNFITKDEANARGWESGPLWEYAPGCSIGGDRYYNYDDMLPSDDTAYIECDIGYDGGKRNAARLILPVSEGNIYYTNDHYNTFYMLKIDFDQKEPSVHESRDMATVPPVVTADLITPNHGDLAEDGEYTTSEDVAKYIHMYGHLPSNYVTLDKAKAAGFNGDLHNLGEVLPGKRIGGQEYENKKGLLPEADGRIWYECDVDNKPEARGSKRLVFSNDGLIYYSPDRFKSFTPVYNGGDRA